MDIFTADCTRASILTKARVIIPDTGATPTIMRIAATGAAMCMTLIVRRPISINFFKGNIKF